MDSPKPDWRAALSQRFAADRGAQGKFAAEVGCSESHLSLVLKGKRNVSYQLATRIKEKTGVPVDELMAPPLAPGGDAE